jgi:hypothetical protein
MHIQTIEYVPIDFIKAEVIGMQIEDFTSNPILEAPVSIYDGELLTKTIYNYKNLRIKIFENNKRIEFSGSLHTFYNDGKHNYNDFSKSMLNEALSVLFKSLKIKPHNLYLIHLEWGFNIEPPFTSNYVLDRLIQHKSINKTVGIDCKIEGKYIQFKHSNMVFKIYNKAKHFNLKNELMRIEIKQTNWSKYRIQGIRTLADFMNSCKNQFLNELLNQWNRVIFYDIDNCKEDKYLKYQTHIFWDETRKNRSNKNFKYHFDKLKKLNEEIGFNSQNIIRDAIIKKGNELQL